MAVRIGGDGGGLRNQTDRLQPPRLDREDVLGVRVERGERADGADEHPHRMGVVLKALHQLRDVGVQHRVKRDVLRPLTVLRVVRQLAEQNQVRRFEEVAVLRQLLDRIAAVEQNALVAVDERDPAAASGGIRQRRVVRHHPELVRHDLDLPQIHRANRAVVNWDVVRLAGAVVGDRQRIGHAQVLSGRLLVALAVAARAAGAGRAGPGAIGTIPGRRVLITIGGHAIVLRQPPAEIREATAFAAERPPGRVHPPASAIDAEGVGWRQTGSLYQS
jgi:hypothetical protein